MCQLLWNCLCIDFVRIVRRFKQIREPVTSPNTETSVASVNASDAWFTAAVTAIYTALVD
jgi:hypothetical protein